MLSETALRNACPPYFSTLWPSSWIRGRFSYLCPYKAWLKASDFTPFTTFTFAPFLTRYLITSSSQYLTASRNDGFFFTFRFTPFSTSHFTESKFSIIRASSKGERLVYLPSFMSSSISNPFDKCSSKASVFPCKMSFTMAGTDSKSPMSLIFTIKSPIVLSVIIYFA